MKGIVTYQIARDVLIVQLDIDIDIQHQGAVGSMHVWSMGHAGKHHFFRDSFVLTIPEIPTVFIWRVFAKIAVPVERSQHHKTTKELFLNLLRGPDWLDLTNLDGPKTHTQLFWEFFQGPPIMGTPFLISGTDTIPIIQQSLRGEFVWEYVVWVAQGSYIWEPLKFPKMLFSGQTFKSKSSIRPILNIFLIRRRCSDQQSQHVKQHIKRKQSHENKEVTDDSLFMLSLFFSTLCLSLSFLATSI